MEIRKTIIWHIQQHNTLYFGKYVIFKDFRKISYGGGHVEFKLIQEMDSGLFRNGYLHARWEADQIGAQSEAGALSGCDTDRGRHGVKDGEHDGGEDGEGGDFIKW